MNTILIVLLTGFFLLGFGKSGDVPATSQTLNLQGAWQTNHGENEVTMICSEKYFSVAIYNAKQKTFTGTHGGSYRIEGNEFAVSMEFHSMNPELVGEEIRSRVDLRDGLLTFTNKDEKVAWKRIDNGTPGKLAGAWLITGRIRNGQMGKMTPGARRTMKILSGTRFQWIAYNVDTKEFSGTGGGNYTTENGKYTENIEFFSRDNSRVGASLTFDFSMEDENWRHQGKSSKGDPVDEVWTKREKIGL
jgi:hypothetical protein